MIVEPFRNSFALLDSYTYHSSCEHTLLITCDLFDPQPLSISVNHNPSDLNLLGLAIHMRNKRMVLYQDGFAELTNVGDAIFRNETHTQYSDGLTIIEEGRLVSIILAESNIKVEVFFGVNDREVRIEITEKTAVLNYCGLCGTSSGTLLYSDRNETADIVDQASVEEFAQSWRVDPREQVLMQQGQECGMHTEL